MPAIRHLGELETLLVREEIAQVGDCGDDLAGCSVPLGELSRAKLLESGSIDGVG
jgi:hypothetical protein